MGNIPMLNVYLTASWCRIFARSELHIVHTPWDFSPACHAEQPYIPFCRTTTFNSTNKNIIFISNNEKDFICRHLNIPEKILLIVGMVIVVTLNKVH